MTIVSTLSVCQILGRQLARILMSTLGANLFLHQIRLTSGTDTEMTAHRKTKSIQCKALHCASVLV